MEESTESILRWFSTIDNEWLLVFDNADNDPDTIVEFLPRGNRGNVLITSRNPNIRRNVASNAWAEVDTMEIDDAISLLLKAAYLDESSDELRLLSRSIVTELCFLALAIDQAGAAIASGVCDIHDYLRMYSKHRQKLLADPSFRGASKYGRAVVAGGFAYTRPHDRHRTNRAPILWKRYRSLSVSQTGQGTNEPRARALSTAGVGTNSKRRGPVSAVSDINNFQFRRRDRR